MKTEHRRELEERHKKFIKDKKLNIIVVNTDTLPNGVKAEVRSVYHSIEEAEHKVALDIMTNAFYGFKEPIKLFVKVKN